MLVIIRSAPDTVDGRRGIALARDMAANICLIQNAVSFAHKNRFEGFCGTVYVLDEDCRLRGLKRDELVTDVIEVDYDSLVDLMARDEKVIGIF